VKLCSLKAIFIYNVSEKVIAKLRQNPDLCHKVQSVQISPDSATRLISDSLNSKLTDRLESDNEPSKNGES
jgi:hypothetical protein